MDCKLKSEHASSRSPIFWSRFVNVACSFVPRLSTSCKPDGKLVCNRSRFSSASFVHMSFRCSIKFLSSLSASWRWTTASSKLVDEDVDADREKAAYCEGSAVVTKWPFRTRDAEGSSYSTLVLPLSVSDCAPNLIPRLDMNDVIVFIVGCETRKLILLNLHKIDIQPIGEASEEARCHWTVLFLNNLFLTPRDCSVFIQTVLVQTRIFPNQCTVVSA